MPVQLDDPFNFANFDPLGGGGRRAGTPPAVPSLLPEEEQSALGKIADLGLGGLGFVGGILNKPGRVVRGLLGGQPRELLNAIPFSDTLGITDPSQQVHGTDLLGISRDQADQAGFFSPEGLGGFAAEMATDPLNFLSFGGGALTKAGQLAKKAGVLPKGVPARVAGFAAGSPEAAAVANKAAQLGHAGISGTEALGGHVGVGLPFMGNNFGTFDLGPLGGALGGTIAKYPKGAGAAIGAGVGGLSGAMSDDGNPLTGAVTGGLLGFGAGAAGSSKLGAAALDAANRVRKALFVPEVMGQLSPKGQELMPRIYAARQAAKESSLANDVLPVARAGGADLLTDTQGLRTLAEGGMGPTSAGTQQAFPIAQTRQEIARARGEAAGLDVPKIENYWHRQASNPEWDVGRPGGHGTGSALAPFTTSMLEREPILKDLPTATIESMVADPRLTSKVRTAASNADAAKVIAANYGIADPIQAESLAGFLHSLDARRLKSGFFARHAVTDYESGIVGINQAAGAAEEMSKIIAEEASAVQGPGAKTYHQVIADLGLGNTSAARANVQQQMVALGKSPLADQYLSRETADALTRATKAYTTPEVLAPVVKFIDNFTNFLKGGLTSPFPSFNIRNLASGAWQNYVLMGAKDLPEAYKASATALREGGVVPGIANSLYKGQGLSDAAATKKFADLAFTHGIMGGGGARDVVGADAAEELLMRIPGAMPGRKPGLEMFPQAVRDYVPTSLEQANPLNVRGVGGRTKSTFAPVAAGQRVGNEIEDMGRLAGFYGLLKQGYEPGVASDLVKAGHVDYTKATGFERNVMKRLIPFYGWLRGNLPEQIRQVAEGPGGAAATAIKASEAANRGHFVPDYLGQGVTVPLGNEEEGQQRYLTRTGLPFEDLGQTSARSILGSLNPLLKYPLEQATGRQMFSDRDLRDLHSRIGDLVPGGAPPPLENALMNSPISRLITTGSTLVDERKSLWDKLLNLTTGLKVSDVDVNQARRNVTRDFINANLRGPNFRHFDELSVRPEALPLLSPQEMELFRLHLTQDRRARQAAKNK